MAHLELKSGKKMPISRQQGLFLWKALHDPSGLDEEQLAKVANIKALYLNWRVAPDDYIKENLVYIIPMALSDWIYDRAGKPLKPQSDHAWKFARRWGLWDNGQKTSLVTNPARFTQATFAGSFAVNDR